MVESTFRLMRTFRSTLGITNVHRFFIQLKLVIYLLVSLWAGQVHAEQADVSQIPFAIIKQFAALSNAAYSSESGAKSLSDSLGMQLSAFHQIPGFEVQYFIVSDPINNNKIIVVRGTANLENALVDIDAKLQVDKLSGINLHNGFARAAQAIYFDIEKNLQKNASYYTTGHSLGGAVALILAMYLDRHAYQVQQVVSFGQPKVTDLAGAKVFKHLRVLRVVTEKDIVPLVPPLDPSNISNLNIYWHLGTEMILLQGKNYAKLSGINSMLRAAKVVTEKLNTDNLDHHKMAHYLELINAKQAQANLVPYDSNINLKKLFGFN